MATDRMLQLEGTQCFGLSPGLDICLLLEKWMESGFLSNQRGSGLEGKCF